MTLSSRLISRSKGELMFIDYAVPTGAQITIEIFDDTGSRKNVLVEKTSSSGRTSWDGKSGSGNDLPPGIYIIVLYLSGNQIDAKYYPVVLAP